METFLTCRKLAEYLSENILSDNAGKMFEETALNAVYKTLSTNVAIADLRLLLSELPIILSKDYPVVKEIYKSCVNLIPPLMNTFRVNNLWKEFTALEYLLDMLKTFELVKNHNKNLTLDSPNLPK